MKVLGPKFARLQRIMELAKNVIRDDDDVMERRLKEWDGKYKVVKPLSAARRRGSVATVGGRGSRRSLLRNLK